MGRSFYTPRQTTQPQPQIASPHEEESVVKPEMPIPAYIKWSPENAFDPDSEEFFRNAVYEAIVPPPSPISPMSSASDSSSDRASSRDLSPPHFRDASEDQPSGLVSGEPHSHPDEHDASFTAPRWTTGGRAPIRRLPNIETATRTYRPLWVGANRSSELPGITTLDIGMDPPSPESSSDSDDEHENNPARLSTVHPHRVPIPPPSSIIGPRRRPVSVIQHDPTYLAAIDTGATFQPITPPQALRELFADTSEPPFVASTPVSTAGNPIPPAPTTPAADMTMAGAMFSPSPPPSVTPRLYSWTGNDSLPTLRVPESPSTGRDRDGRDRSASAGSPSGRGLRTVNGARNARWPVY